MAKYFIVSIEENSVETAQADYISMLIIEITNNCVICRYY